jgi:transcriptional antiterminator NusG
MAVAKGTVGNNGGGNRFGALLCVVSRPRGLWVDQTHKKYCRINGENHPFCYYIDREGASVDLKWYIVHTYSGFENKVKKTLEERIKNLGQEEFFGKVLVPTEQVVELRQGQKRTSSRKFYPGYILVQMQLNDDTWHTVRNTAKVTGFVGGEVKPTPIPDEEAERIIQQMQEGVSKPKPRYQFEEGDEVRVVDGPFSNFQGIVEEVKPDKEKLRVLITIFGRPTPVELEFIQVNKV